jgi:predicted nucleic acid-binding protein
VGLFSTIANSTRRWLGWPTHDAAGTGRRSRAWSPGNPGAMSALSETHADLLSKSRDLARRNVWAHAALEAYVSNAIGTGIKPQSMITQSPLREAVHRLWADWTLDADVAGLTDFYGLQALACRAMLEGGECLIRLRPRPPDAGLVVGLQLQLLEPEHLPITLNSTLDNGHVIRSGIEFDALGRRVAYHLYRHHPDEGAVAHMSTGLDTLRVPAAEIVHLFRPLRPGQIRGEPWLARALVKLHELDQYDDAELVRKKTAAMFAGFVTRRLVLDANILIRASLGSKVGLLILQAQRSCDLFTPEVCLRDAERHLAHLAKSRSLSFELLERSLRNAMQCVEVLSPDFIEAHRTLSQAMIRDPDDWPVLSAAIGLDATVWSEDQDFFGTGVASLVCHNINAWLSSPEFGALTADVAEH